MSDTLWSMVPLAIRASGVTMSSRNFRMSISTCCAIGGTVRFTRERWAGRPGLWSVQSHIGNRMSTVVMSAAAILCAIVITCASSRK